MSGPGELGFQIIAPQAPAAPARSDAPSLFAQALQTAPQAAALSDAIRKGELPLILINDPHRATPTRPALAALARAWQSAGCRPHVRVIIATGTHAFDPRERSDFERKTLDGCGLTIAAVSWHDVRAPARLGGCAGVRMHRWVCESGWLVAVGSVEPHYFAGLTGAHKTATIGVLAREDIERNHAGALDPRSGVFALAGNPVHEGIATILARMAAEGKNLLAMNALTCADDIAAVAAGDALGTLAELLPQVRQIYQRTIPRAADMLWLRVPRPLGRNFYQADKALKNNHQAVRDGGGILLEAGCEEGIGPDAFVSLLRQTRTYAAAQACVAQRGYRLGDHKAVKLRYLTDPAQRGVHLALVARGVTAAEAATLGVELFDEPRAAVAWLCGRCGACATRVCVEDAGNAVVLAQGSDAR